MKNQAIAAVILGGQGVSLAVTGEELKVDTLRGELKYINPGIGCSIMLDKHLCKLTVHIPPMGLDAMRQRVVSALEQCGLDVQNLQPEPDHEKTGLPK